MSDRGPVESLVVGVGAALSFTGFDGDGEYGALLDDSTERSEPRRAVRLTKADAVTRFADRAGPAASGRACRTGSV